MDGRNSSGARVSLLNETSQEKAGPGLRRPTSLAHYHYAYSHSSHSSSSQLHAPHFHHSHHSRTSSFASTPVLSSPPTPQLYRSDSSDSAASRLSSNTSDRCCLSRANSKMNLDLDLNAIGLTSLARTPSPITPVGLDFDGIAAVHPVNTSPDGKLHLATTPAVVGQQGPYSAHASAGYYPPMDGSEERTQPTSTSPNSASSLHPYPSLAAAHPFGYPPSAMHGHLGLPPSMGQAPMYPIQPAPGISQQQQQTSPRQQAAQQQLLAQQTLQQQQQQQPHRPQQIQQLPNRQQDSSMPAPNATASTKQPGKKNQYPCPLAKEYNCNNFFTTSGHAARHAKKHTGKKDAFCPECNKSFTRKDNMEQHRRTHQNGRAASKTANGNATSTATGSNATDGAPATKRQKTSSVSSPSMKQAVPKSSKPAHIAAAAIATAQASPANLDPSLPISPASTFSFSDAAAGLGLPVQLTNQVYPDLLNQSPFGGQVLPYPPQVPYYDSSNMSGLDKLAMAATGERSRSNSS